MRFTRPEDEEEDGAAAAALELVTVGKPSVRIRKTKGCSDKVRMRVEEVGKTDDDDGDGGFLRSTEEPNFFKRPPTLVLLLLEGGPKEPEEADVVVVAAAAALDCEEGVAVNAYEISEVGPLSLRSPLLAPLPWPKRRDT